VKKKTQEKKAETPDISDNDNITQDHTNALNITNTQKQTQEEIPQTPSKQFSGEQDKETPDISQDVSE